MGKRQRCWGQSGHRKYRDEGEVWTLGKANDTDQNSLILCSSGTKRGVVGFKGCTSSLSYRQQISYLVAPPGVSIASYSHVCRRFLCNNLTSLQPFVGLKAKSPKSTSSSSNTCPTCVGKHDEDCLPNFVSTETCPSVAPSCYSSTFKFQAGERRGTLFIKCLLYARCC